jgi:signal transduction histidine kinase
VSAGNRRILVVDDNRAIHKDFQKILGGSRPISTELEELEANLFGHRSATPLQPFSVDSAYQGEEAAAMVRAALDSGRPYALAFIDVRMPPGWDGVETAQHIWEIDPDVQIVICTAYSDYSWEDTVERLGENSERFLILKKPFDQVEARQLAVSLTKKWDLARQARAKFDELEEIIQTRTTVIREAHERLQREMTQRHIMEAQLRRAQKLEALGRLAAGIAHEINNPLAFVIANMNHVREALEPGASLLDEAVMPDLRAALDEACVGGERIKQIVRDLKAFAQPHDESLATIDVRPVVEFSIKMAMAEIKRVAELVTEIEDVPAVWAIGGRLEQVFVNLLINATQAIAPGHVQDNQIRVSIKNAAEAVIVEITDTGSGIPAENLERIFDPFFTTKPVGVGTGLGLSICHSIIAAFGGDMTVTSQVGRGSTFRVSLPCTDQPLRSTLPPEDSRPVARAARILVVDPEPAITKAMRRLLSAHRVETADSGLEALAICQERRFDLVLYDLRTADLSGPDIYRRLQEAGHGCERRLVFTNAGTIPTAVDAFLAETNLPCLEKPFGAREVNQLLDRS